MKFFAFLLGLTLAAPTLLAQNGTPNLSNSVTVDISADRLWEEVRRMDNVDELTQVVADVKWEGPKGVGGQRTCTAADGQGFFVELVQEFDDANRTYQWEVTQGVPAKNVKNRFRVVDLGYNRSMLVFTSHFDFLENPNMTADQFRGFLNMASLEMMGNLVKKAQS